MQSETKFGQMTRDVCNASLKIHNISQIKTLINDRTFTGNY